MTSVETAMEQAEKTKEDATCIVCMECISAENQCRRVCGHMMCVACDTAWRTHGQVEEIKMKKIDTPEVCSVFINVSSCPYCRRKGDPLDYMSRSKDSLFREIQVLTQTLFLYRVKTPLMCTQPISFDELGSFAPDAAPVAPVPRQLMLVPAIATASTGRCSRSQYGCRTVRTKLHCESCNQLLCRSCRGLCRHAL